MREKSRDSPSPKAMSAPDKDHPKKTEAVL